MSEVFIDCGILEGEFWSMPRISGGRSKTSGICTSEELSKGVAIVSGDEVSESLTIGRNGGVFDPIARIFCSEVEGVEARVAGGSGEYEVDGDGALDTLSSLDTRVGFAEES